MARDRDRHDRRRRYAERRGREDQRARSRRHGQHSQRRHAAAAVDFSRQVRRGQRAACRYERHGACRSRKSAAAATRWCCTASSGTGGVLISSSTNQFENVVDGLDLTVNDGSLKPVTVSVKASTQLACERRQGVRGRLQFASRHARQGDRFNAEDLTTGILFGTQRGAARR